MAMAMISFYRNLRSPVFGKSFHLRAQDHSHLAAHRLMCSSTATGGKGDNLSSLLARIAAGEISASSAASELSPLLVSGGARAEDVGGFAKVDHDRRRRTGFPEVVFGEGKSAQQIVDILAAMIKESDERQSTAAAGGGVATSGGGGAAAVIPPGSPIVATRVCAEKWSAISAAGVAGLRYHADARIVYFGGPHPRGEESNESEVAGTAGRVTDSSIGKVAVLSAGTSDLWVAEEAAVLAELSGAEVSRFHDVGVAGIHRLLGVIPSVEEAGVAICVAGMDGAMPGVVAGLVKCPVVAVPTSVGYGAAMSGLAPLLTMLNACAPGVSVVNIDNGFGAAAFAVKLLKRSNEGR